MQNEAITNRSTAQKEDWLFFDFSLLTKFASENKLFFRNTIAVVCDFIESPHLPRFMNFLYYYYLGTISHYKGCYS